MQCGALLQWGNEVQRMTGPLSPDRGRIDLGLDLAAHHLHFGQTLTHQQIADWCGCSRGLIYMIEKKALRKLRRKEAFMRVLRESEIQ